MVTSQKQTKNIQKLGQNNRLLIQHCIGNSEIFGHFSQFGLSLQCWSLRKCILKHKRRHSSRMRTTRLRPYSRTCFNSHQISAAMWCPKVYKVSSDDHQMSLTGKGRVPVHSNPKSKAGGGGDGGRLYSQVQYIMCNGHTRPP